jgi:hypothetical protein
MWHSSKIGHIRSEEPGAVDRHEAEGRPVPKQYPQPANFPSQAFRPFTQSRSLAKSFVSQRVNATDAVTRDSQTAWIESAPPL